MSLFDSYPYFIEVVYWQLLINIYIINIISSLHTMQNLSIIPYSPQKASLSWLKVINPILSDFFWVEDALKIQELLNVSKPKDFTQELHSYFLRNPEKEWTFKQIFEMFDELINMILSRTGDRKRRIISIVEDILLMKGHDSNLIDMLCQMKVIFERNIKHEMKVTWKLISRLRLDTIDSL
ncbi:MAG: hypothetical protein ACD_2C00013G0011 [uncultured bacterium (gcode 4)]|uniref:Uncharacterized protein n=1 Tax=uncultured bacterium (gcode 4) TaxID=1234023 RepID=K2G4W3_9BACT|nr:MAG: hypothetical protein ACD_2C00013G0011 [uncultured bacterium (gcode 4)]